MVRKTNKRHHVKLFLPILLFLVMFCCHCKADEAFVSYGLGVAESSIHYTAETKVLNLGYRAFLNDSSPFYLEGTGGFWLDSSGDPNRSSSGFFSLSPGIKIDFHGFELRNAYGVALITSPDGYLGGPFQFHGEVYAGFRDAITGYGIGIKYNHFSSAGIEQPNVGRDFLMLEISLKVW